MEKLMNFMLFSCKKVTTLIEKKEVLGKLSWMQNTKLKVHTSMCVACKSYADQSKQLDETIMEHLGKKDVPHKSLQDDTKSKMLQAIIDKAEG